MKVYYCNNCGDSSEIAEIYRYENAPWTTAGNGHNGFICRDCVTIKELELEGDNG